jgi:segregation and condensation protein B
MSDDRGDDEVEADEEPEASYEPPTPKQARKKKRDDDAHEETLQGEPSDLDEPLVAGALDLSEEGEFEREGPGLVGTADLAPEHLKGALEALILVSDKPVQAVRLARLTSQDLGAVRRALAEIAEDYRGRGISLDEIAGGFQFRTSPKFAPFVRMLVQQKPTRLSRAQLEALSIIAYRQPVTRPEIDDVRGVDSGSALKLLLERNLIKIIGKKEEAGRPLLYGTSTDFLELFGLKNLRDLPTLREFSELTQESRDIFERRIGEPLPGQGQGMDMQTHYEAEPLSAEQAEREAAQEAAEDAAAAQLAEDERAAAASVVHDDDLLDAERDEREPAASDDRGGETSDDGGASDEG